MSFTPSELQLEHLFRRRFDIQALHQLLVRLPVQGDHADHLLDPKGSTPAAYARQAVRVLIARSLVRGELFEQMAEAIPGRVDEVWAIAALFGVHNRLAGVLSPLPKEYSQYADAHTELRTFVGRAEQLKQLEEVLLPQSGLMRAAVVCNLRGMAGVGKTFLVEQFYVKHLEQFPGGHLKITLGFNEAPTGDSLLSSLAERLDVEPNGEGRLEDRVRAASMAFRALLHLDNVDSEAQARGAAELVARLPGVPIVLAGRYQFGQATPGWRLVHIESFSVSEALGQLAKELLPQVGARVPDGSRHALVGALGGLPLGIHLAASYLNAGYRVEDFLETLAESGLSMRPFSASDTAYLDRAERAMRATFEMSLKALHAELGADADMGVRGVAALGVAPLVGVGRSWMQAIVGAPPGRVIRWVSLAVKLSIVQHDIEKERWRVHKLLAEYMREVLRDEAGVPGRQTTSHAAHTQAPSDGGLGLWARASLWIRSQFGGADDAEAAYEEASEVVDSSGAAYAATARMDAWVFERLAKEPMETRGVRWGELHEEHDGLAEWVTGLEGERAAVGAYKGYEYASESGPFVAWLGAFGRGLNATNHSIKRSNLLWRQANLARLAGEVDLALHAVTVMAAQDATQTIDRELALAAGFRADLLEERGQRDEALRLRRDEALPVFERYGDLHSIAVTTDRIADLLLAQGADDEALHTWQTKVLPLFERLDDPLGKARTMGKIADVAWEREQFDEALRIRKEVVLPILERLGELREKAKTMGKIADILHVKGELEEVLRIRNEEELPVYERLGDLRLKAFAMGSIADVHHERGEFDEALRIRRDEVLPVFTKLKSLREMAFVKGQIAGEYRALGQLDEALRLWQKVLPIFEQLGEVRDRANTLANIADVLHRQGRLDEALRIRRDEVLPVHLRYRNARGTAVTTSKIAELLFERGEIDESLRLWQKKVLPIYEQLEDWYGRGVTMRKIADGLSARGEHEEALRLRCEEVLPFVQLIGNTSQKAVVLGKIADSLLALRKYDEALAWEREALTIHDERGERRELVVGQAKMAIILICTGRPEHAPEVYSLLFTALESAVQLGLPDEAAHVRRVFSRVGLTPPF